MIIYVEQMHILYFLGAKYVYLEDNHTSVVGIREVAVEHGASCYCVSYQKWVVVSFHLIT